MAQQKKQDGCPPKQDFSKISKQKLKIKSSEYKDLEQEIKKIKYPTYAISTAESLEAKIQTFSPEIQQKLKKQLVNLNSYRKVRGDGNCFYRALAFCSLEISENIDMKSCFPLIDQLSLTCCVPQSIPNEFKKFYQHKFLLSMFNKCWDSLYSKHYKQCNKNSRKALLKLFDEYPFMDFIAILYFRAVSLKALWKLQQKVKQYLLGKQEEYIRKYSSQTEGVTINICSMMLNMVINVYQIRKSVIKTYHYDNVENKKGQIHLLFYQNHYDIIQKNDLIQDQKNSISTCSSFFTDVSKKMVKGQCIQCYKRGSVFQQSSICELCFEIMQRAVKKFKNPQLVYGRCSDCYRYKSSINKQIGICQDCIEYQNKIIEKNKTASKKEEFQRNQQKKQQRKQQRKQQSKQQQKQRIIQNKIQKPKQSRGKCLECDSFRILDGQTGICNSCMDKQKFIINRMQNKKKIQQKYENKKGISPVKQNIYGIGKQIKRQGVINRQSMRQSSKPKEQKDEPPKYNVLAFSNTGIDRIQKCEKCNSMKFIEEKTNLCIRCYKQQYCQLGECKKCFYKMALNPSTKKCKNCNEKFSGKSKNCLKCLFVPAYKEGYCYQCYTKHFCIYCKKIKLISMIIGGRCEPCRRVY